MTRIGSRGGLGHKSKDKVRNRLMYVSTHIANLGDHHSFSFEVQL